MIEFTSSWTLNVALPQRNTAMDYTVNIIEDNGEYFLQEVFALTEFQYVEQVTAGPFKARWEADVKRSWMYPAYRGLTDELCRLQH